MKASFFTSRFPDFIGTGIRHRDKFSFFLFPFSLFLLLSCNRAEKLEPVETKDEYGYTEKYYRRVSDYAKEGWYQKFDMENRKIEDAHYVHDTLDGLRILYYDDGDTMSVETYRKGAFEGPFRAYHENGQLKTAGIYENNAMAGQWHSYYENGRLRESVTFRDNAENGPFIEYHPNGKLKAEGAYLDGDNEHGELKVYDENGVLLRTMMCNRGACKTIK